MKDAFPEYYRHTQEHFDRLWSEGLFVLDTNALLNLYRYSEHTRDQLFTILKDVRVRLWMPHQVAHEFLKRRLAVIHDKHRSYDFFIGYLNGIEDESRKLHRDGEIEARKPLEQVTGSVNGLIEELEKQKSMLPSLSNSPDDDCVWSIIEELYEKNLGAAFSSEEMSELIKDGKIRYANKIPPGYEDADKKQNEVDKFGDLIIWKQLLNKAKADETPVVFVTDDRKDDWWWISKGRTIGPQPELTKEVLDESGQLFHMYTPDGFMSEAEKYLDREVSSKAIDEAQALDPLEEESIEEETEQIYDASLVREAASIASSLPAPNELHFANPSLTSAGRAWEALNNPEVRKAQEQMRLPSVRAAAERLNSPEMQEIAKKLNSREAQQAIKTLNSPAVQAAQRALSEAMNKGRGPLGKGP